MATLCVYVCPFLERGESTRYAHSNPTIMSVYTVREATGDKKPNSHLISRGLNARTATISALDPIAVPSRRQLAYDIYTKLLPAFMVFIPFSVFSI
jgi:hypothetical protein